MKCVKCEVELPDGANFCGECESPQRKVCGKCGTENPITFKICTNCGGDDFTPPDGRPRNRIKDVYGF